MVHETLFSLPNDSPGTCSLRKIELPPQWLHSISIHPTGINSDLIRQDRMVWQMNVCH